MVEYHKSSAPISLCPQTIEKINVALTPIKNLPPIVSSVMLQPVFQSIIDSRLPTRTFFAKSLKNFWV
jgi:hypothetical protein